MSTSPKPEYATTLVAATLVVVAMAGIAASQMGLLGVLVVGLAVAAAVAACITVEGLFESKEHVDERA